MSDLFLELEERLDEGNPISVGEALYDIKVSLYGNDRIKLTAVFHRDLIEPVSGIVQGRAGDTYRVLTINMSAEHLRSRCIIVESYRHDQELYATVLATFPELFRDTNRQLTEGHRIGNIWEVIE